MIIVNLYNKPNNDLPINYLNYFTKYFKLLILGDFNAHHRIWGSTNCGAALADWVTSNDYILLNTTQPTHYSDANPNIWFLLDLSIASPGLAHKCTTIITSDFLGSDHSILFVNINENVSTVCIYRVGRSPEQIGQFLVRNASCSSAPH